MSFLVAVSILLSTAANTALPAPDTASGETETWNRGVGYYNAGDITNAFSVFNSLLLSRRYGARAAEVVAKIHLEQGRHEESAAAAAIALRSDPDDARLNRNFTRAVAAIPALRKEKRIEEAIRLSQGRQPDDMVREAVYSARDLMEKASSFLKKTAAEAVSAGDGLSARAEKLSMLWPPVRAAVLQAVTNEQHAAEMIEMIDSAEKSTLEAARLFSDLDASAYTPVSSLEMAATDFLKILAMPPVSIDEDMAAQSNAFMNVDKVNGRDWQEEALKYTRAFRAKFPAWARAYEQQAQADTNRPPFTAETQAKISALAHQLEKVQLECVSAVLPPEMEKALGLISEIKDLMPKNPSSGAPRSQPDNPNPQNDNQQNQENEKKDEDEGNQGSEQNEPQKDDAGQEEEKQDDKKGDSPEDSARPEVESVLRKAQERTDEHEEEKKRRMRQMKLPPDERDW